MKHRCENWMENSGDLNNDNLKKNDMIFQDKQWWFDLADISGFHERKTRDFWNGWLSEKCVGLVLALPPVFARAIDTVYQFIMV